ncbi:Clp protease N-terminal domain-containing protein [Frankia sp. R82]|uniref:Clp protease N-terminal domain-containing protein n=1 Tax=Frankia sp. R82 TaxID=2950553 RepID=UPI002042E340|nr:Clp protease N-terminal domain-containing protein [Frankia sp. R82]MCM3887246.1 Clp protease [Frankia sp. R82]
MFERFTSAARRVVVHAQEEARDLDHNYIGTEHLLLGLLAETDGIAAHALAEIDLSLEMTRSRIVVAVGRGKKPLKGHIPFTPRAKKVLEKSLREALGQRHSHIGTEHILLGLLAVNGGLSATLLDEWKVDRDQLRTRVLALTAAAAADRAAGVAPSLGLRVTAPGSGGDPGAGNDAAGLVLGATAAAPRRTAAAEAGLSGAGGFAGGDPIGSHHLMLALLGDPDSAATRTLMSLGLDVAAARDALLQADLTDTSDELPEVTGRRGMSLRLTDSAVVVEATDRRLLGLARLAFSALGGSRPVSPPVAGTDPTDPTAAGETTSVAADRVADPTADRLIHGQDEIAESLSAVWTVLEASLADIRSRALGAPPHPPAPDTPADPDTPAAEDLRRRPE